MKQLKKLVGEGALFSSLALLLALSQPALAVDVSNSIISGNFQSLKEALENPERDTTVVVPGGEYVVTEPLTITKDLDLKNEAGKKVTLKLGFFTTSSSSNGDSMVTVTGGHTTLSGDTNDNLVFDGAARISFDHQEDFVSNGGKSITEVSGTGVLFTLANDTRATINHATFTNSASGGITSGTVMIKSGATLTMNDGAITHNYAIQTQKQANEPYFSDPNAARAHAAGMSIYGGTFIMKGGSITDNYNHLGTGGAIGSSYPGTGLKPSIQISGGTISNNSSHSWPEHSSGAGGGIFLGVGTSITIDGGTFTNNYANGAGGFLYADWSTNVTVNGGTFSGNRAQRAGGVIAIVDKFMSYNADEQENEISTGEINPYHITDIKTWYDKYKLGSYLTVTGGTFKQNQAYMGGALYISADKSQILGGTFDGNEANRFGGAIYLSTQPYTMTIKNAYITNNSASDDSISLGNQYYPDLNPGYFHPGSGAGIWYCPTGTGSLNVSNGVAVFGNTAAIEGDDFTSMKKVDDKPYTVSVANRMLGGGYVAWYADEKDNRTSEATPEHEPMQDSTDDLMLKAKVDPRSQETARALAKTVFINNKAKRGGAIATNGHIDFGDAQLTFDLAVQKDWSSLVPEKSRKDLVAELYVVTTQDGNEVLHYVDEVALTKDNGYTATFAKLPLENYGRTTYRVVEKDAGFDVSYQLTRPNKEGVEAGSLTEDTNTFTTKDLVNGDSVHLTITNKPYYAVNYQFKAADATQTLPEEVMALLPEAQEKQAIGTKVTPAALSTTKVQTEEGTWTFEGWDPASATIVDANLLFTGTWRFEKKIVPPAPTYTAHFSFISSVEGRELPETVRALVPADKGGLHAGDTVVAPNVAPASVKVEGGTWAFVGWSAEKQVVADKDIEFVGSWSFSADQQPPVESTYEVHFSFVSADANDVLPQEILKMLPKTITNVRTGTELSAPSVVPASVKVEGGTWTFVGWSAEKQVVADKDIEFVGTWAFEKDAEEPVNPPKEDEKPTPTQKPESNTKPGSENQNGSEQPKPKPAVKAAIPDTGDPLSAALPAATGLATLGAGLLFAARARKKH